VISSGVAVAASKLVGVRAKTWRVTLGDATVVVVVRGSVVFV
jgi:hypothetical protein